MGSRCTSAAQMVLNLQAKMLLVSMNRRVKASTRTSHGLKTSNSSSRAKLHSMRRSKRSVRALSSNVLRMPNGRAPPRQATLSRVKQLHRPLVAMALRHMLVDQHRTAEPVIESLLVSGKLIQSKAPVLQCSAGLLYFADSLASRPTCSPRAPGAMAGSCLRRRPAEWDVGVRMGSALRAAYQAADTASAGGEGASPRGHIRRAHWHGYWSGSIKDGQGEPVPSEKRKFDLRWQPPVAVNLGTVEGMPSVVRPFK